MRFSIYIVIFFVMLVGCSSTDNANRGAASEIASGEASDIVEAADIAPVDESIYAEGRSFINKFKAGPWKKCGRGCKLVTPWVAGDYYHCKRRSCHNSRQAVDIHTISCGGKKLSGKSKAGKRKFDQISPCLKKYGTTLWRVKNHHGHMHFNFRGCNKRKGTWKGSKKTGRCY